MLVTLFSLPYFASVNKMSKEKITGFRNSLRSIFVIYISFYFNIVGVKWWIVLTAVLAADVPGWGGDPKETRGGVFDNPRELQAQRAKQAITIDGDLNEDGWLKTPAAGEFIQIRPHPGEKATFSSQVKVMYDDEALYIGAILFDPNPDSIQTELTDRDRYGNADRFFVLIDTYRSGLTAFSFGTSASGVQYDTRVHANGQTDEEWDAVWTSAVKLVDQGWVAEFKIPFAALRFPKTDAQVWFINFTRDIRRLREESNWNPIKPELNQYILQSGLLTGIQNINPPVRLSAYPFVALNGQSYHDKHSDPRNVYGHSVTGGMDVKFGLSDAFTLDMTLVPDFGQVQSDNQVLNLSPFEVRFDENRQFFTEGTEIFNRAGLFYSRRIGGRPVHYDEVEAALKEGEVVVNNPSETKLINATKISGRTAAGTGLGLFNAVAAPAHAVIEDQNGQTRVVTTNPLTNYNILSFDQNLNNNSYFSLINTNVWRDGADYEANVTGSEFAFNNRNRSYGLSGRLAVSQKYLAEDDPDLGETFNLSLNKLTGTWQWRMAYNYESPDYDINDLGFINSANEHAVTTFVSYQIFQPFWKLNRLNISANTFYLRLAEPNVYSDFGINIRSQLVTRKFWGTGLTMRLEPIVTHDYFEPRTADLSRYVVFPANYMIGSFISSNYNHRLAMDLNGNYRWFDEAGRYSLSFGVSPRFRVNDKLSLNWSLWASNNFKSTGFVDNDGDQIIFGQRDLNTVENIFRTNFTFNNKAALSFRLRHYWSKVDYQNFAALTNEGYLGATEFNGNYNNSYNAFTVDMVYRWRFAPGSDIFLTWKNSLFSSSSTLPVNYFSNVEDIWDNPVSNSLSLKCVYFFDYNQFRRKLS